MHRADADELVGIIEAAVSAVYQQVQATTGFPLRQWLQIGERTPQGTTFGYGFRAHPFGPIEIDATGLFGLAAVERLIEVLNTRPTVRENLFAPDLNPAMVWMRLLAPVLSACIRRSRSFAQEYDPPLVRTILAEALGSILSDTPVGTLLAPLLNVDVTLDELQFAPNITIRRARLDEIEDFINPPEGPVHLPVSPLVLLTSGAILEINIPHAIGDTMWAVDSMRMADEILTAVRLATGGSAQYAFRWRYNNGPLRNIFIRTEPEIIVAKGETSTLSDGNLTEIVRIYKLIETKQNSSVLDLAMRRWSDSIVRSGLEDRLIDYWIALESIFSPSKEQEIRFRASLRIAAVLGSTADEREHIYNTMLNSYARRSALVHGGQISTRMSKKMTLEEVVRVTGEITRAAILKMLESEPSFSIDDIELRLLRR